ncbi:MAG: Trp biosynthesis-associated membrane protein [Dermatophilaceae bacterium]
MIDALTSKRLVVVLVLVSAAVILVSGSREWVSGTADSAVSAGLGATVLHGTGSEVAPGALAAALVGLASAVAVATSGTVVRFIAACTALLAAILCGAATIGVLVDPDGALGSLAAAGTGRSGALAANGRVTVWVWVALAAALAMGVGGLGAVVGARRWRGLSSRYDAPVADDGFGGKGAKGKASAPGHDSAWDQLSRGEDPTNEG